MTEKKATRRPKKAEKIVARWLRRGRGIIRTKARAREAQDRNIEKGPARPEEGDNPHG